MEPRLKKAM